MTPETETAKPRNIAEALQMRPQPLWDGGLTTWIGKGEDGKLYTFPASTTGGANGSCIAARFQAMPKRSSRGMPWVLDTCGLTGR